MECEYERECKCECACEDAQVPWPGSRYPAALPPNVPDSNFKLTQKQENFQKIGTNVIFGACEPVRGGSEGG